GAARRRQGRRGAARRLDRDARQEAADRDPEPPLLGRAAERRLRADAELDRGVEDRPECIRVQGDERLHDHVRQQLERRDGREHVEVPPARRNAASLDEGSSRQASLPAVATLLDLVRHGDAIAASAGGDAERPLSPRGIGEIALLGRRLTKLGPPPSYVYTSS